MAAELTAIKVSSYGFTARAPVNTVVLGRSLLPSTISFAAASPLLTHLALALACSRIGGGKRMSTPFTRNSIFTTSSEPGAYCLACDMYICTEEGAQAHIKTYCHLALLRCSTVVSQEVEYIKKFNPYFFCEVCNHLIVDRDMLSLHIGEKRHKENSEKEALRKERGIAQLGKPVIIKDIKVTEEAWNSYIDQLCLVCDVTFKNYTIHRYDNGHIINLVRSTVFSDGDNMYRMVRNGFQCLSCNIIIPNEPESLLMDHFDSTDHKLSIVKCKPHETVHNNYYDVGPNPFKKPLPARTVNYNIPHLKLSHPFTLEID